MKTNKKLYSLSFPRMLGLLAHYFLGYLFFYRIIASRISLFLVPDTNIILPWIQICSYIFTAGIAVCLAWPAICDSYRRFIVNKRNSITWIGMLIAIILVVNIAMSFIVSLLTQTTNSANQQEIEQASTMIPVITLLSTCLFSPVVEELVFRAGVFSFLRGKRGFIISALISSILFGSIHIVDSLFAGNFVDASYLLVYAAVGMVLAYGYEKTDSVLVPIGIHVINNVVSILLMYK